MKLLLTLAGIALVAFATIYYIGGLDNPVLAFTGQIVAFLVLLPLGMWIGSILGMQNL